MNQIQVVSEERSQAVQRLGYTEREAQFLCLAGLHSGVFLRRQYTQFLGKAVGGTAQALIEKLFAKGHAKATTYVADIHIYHLCARPFYRALGQEDNRNRRMRQPVSLRAKLMGLDFVLAHPGVPFLATEQEKKDYFLGTLALAPRVLPGMRYFAGDKVTERYFVEKFPISLTPAQTPETLPVASFCYVDEGAVGLSGFATFLRKYQPLFSALRMFQLIYVASTEAHFDASKRLFERYCNSTKSEPIAAAEQFPIDELIAYFEARKLYEARQWDSFDRAKLIRFRADAERFSDSKFASFYPRWQTDGEAGLHASLRPKHASKSTTGGVFSTYLLKENYDLFGSLAA
jgi:hypothetical protein